MSKFSMWLTTITFICDYLSLDEELFSSCMGSRQEYVQGTIFILIYSY